MFEAVVSDALRKVFGSYIADIDPATISLSPWKGTISFHNLKLKTEALDALHFYVPFLSPFQLSTGTDLLGLFF